MKKTIRTILGVLAALGLILSLTACDPPGTQISDKLYSVTKVIPGLQDGEDPYVLMTVTSEANKPIYVEVSVDDGVSSASGRYDQFVLTASGQSQQRLFADPEINAANSYGVDVYVNIYNYTTNGVGEKIESHNIQNLVYSND